jgi:hypothetical protein
MFSTFASFVVLAAALTTANANEYAKFYNGAHTPSFLCIARAYNVLRLKMGRAPSAAASASASTTQAASAKVAAGRCTSRT